MKDKKGLNRFFPIDEMADAIGGYGLVPISMTRWFMPGHIFIVFIVSFIVFILKKTHFQSP